MKKMRLISITLTSLMLTLNASAATIQWNGASGINNNWDTVGNWVGSVEPTDIANIRGGSNPTAVMTSANTISSLLMGGNAGSGTTPNLSLNAGSAFSVSGNTQLGYSLVGDTTTANAQLTINAGIHTVGLLNIANAAGTSAYATTGSLVMTDGSLAAAGVIRIATRGTGATGNTVGTLTLDGGTFLSTATGIGAYIGDYGTGTLTLNGGNATFDGNVNVAYRTGSTGKISLLNGHLDCPTITLGSGSASIEIGQGWLTMDLNKINNINDWVTAGKISAINGIVNDSVFTSVYTVGLTSVTNGLNVLKYGYDGTGTTAVWAATIPEPATLGLFVISGLSLLVFRHLHR